jgi:hypothetical protein
MLPFCVNCRLVGGGALQKPIQLASNGALRQRRILRWLLPASACQHPDQAPKAASQRGLLRARGRRGRVAGRPRVPAPRRPPRRTAARPRGGVAALVRWRPVAPAGLDPVAAAVRRPPGPAPGDRTPRSSNQPTPSSSCPRPVSAARTCGRTGGSSPSRGPRRWATSTSASSKRSAARSARSSPVSSWSARSRLRQHVRALPGRLPELLSPP